MTTMMTLVMIIVIRVIILVPTKTNQAPRGLDGVAHQVRVLHGMPRNVAVVRPEDVLSSFCT